MKVICAPDSFKESLSAVDAANAMARGVLDALPSAVVDRCPVGDGGEGTLWSLLEAVNGRLVAARVRGVFGKQVDAAYGVFDDGGLAYIESAAAIGLAAIPPDRRRVMSASSFGVGELILHAAAAAPGRIVVGVGGSATNDGGCGMAQALGVQFFDASDEPIRQAISGGMLERIARIDMSRRSQFIDNAELTVACDVRNPLTGADGAAYVYAPQKGASAAEVATLDRGLQHLASLIRRDLEIDIEAVAGSGAAGGLAGGLIAFAGAKVTSGIDTVLDATGFDARVRGANLCLTGEGRLDAQSLSGKACIGVARMAATHDVPTVALVGTSGPGADECLHAGISEYVVIGSGLTLAESMRNADTLLAAAAAKVTKKYA